VKIEVNIIWATHQVHHSAEDYNLSTATRQSMFQQSFSNVCHSFQLWLDNSTNRQVNYWKFSRYWNFHWHCFCRHPWFWFTRNSTHFSNSGSTRNWWTT